MFVGEEEKWCKWGENENEVEIEIEVELTAESFWTWSGGLSGPVTNNGSIQRCTEPETETALRAL